METLFEELSTRNSGSVDFKGKINISLF